MAGCVQGDRVEVANLEVFAIEEQMVEVAAVALELRPGIKDLAENILHNQHVLTDTEYAAESFLEIGRG
jgi:hypothetical protein